MESLVYVLLVPEGYLPCLTPDFLLSANLSSVAFAAVQREASLNIRTGER